MRISIRTASIIWCDDFASFEALTLETHACRARDERRMARRRTVVGYCVYCRRWALFSVRGGQPRGAEVNLREGLICRRCGLSNRSRLLYKAVDEWGPRPSEASPRIYLAEALSTFHTRLSARFDRVTASEYVQAATASGTTVELHGRPVLHQDLRALSFPDESFDLVVHADVLEHVPEHRRALAEIHRVLAPGGETLFTAPFIPNRETNLVRASLLPDGEVIHHLEPEIHGDPLDPGGALVFQTFGRELLDELRASGFETASAGFLADRSLAITSGVLFRAQKAPVRGGEEPVREPA